MKGFCWMKDNVEMFMLLASVKDENKDTIGELPVVCEYP